MAYKNGDIIYEDLSINVGKLLQVAGIGEATSGSIGVMVTAAKKIITSIAGTTIATGGNPIVLGTMLTLAAKGIVDYIVGNQISNVTNVKFRLYYTLKEKTVHKQNYTHTILQWNCTDFKLL